MANTDDFIHAINEVIPNAPQLKVGLHVNLTCNKALSGKSTITDKKGILSNTFVKPSSRESRKKFLQILKMKLNLRLESYLNII